MIGIKLKNSVWQKALLNLLKNGAEIYQSGKNYSVVLTDSPKKKNALLVCQQHGGHKHQLDLPVKKSVLQALLAKISPPLKNASFSWNSLHRQLQDKKTQEVIQLTEKEAALIDFLNCCPEKEASKIDLLQNVWQYTEGTNTHTVETTVHTLRQKLGKNANRLIISTKTGYRLV